MLSKILTKEDCARCRFCCSFRRQSLWETPLFDKETLPVVKEKYPDALFKELPDGSVTIDLDGGYKTNDPEEEVLCPFNVNGCVLTPELKPLDCKIWPLRVMSKDGGLVIALTPTCSVIKDEVTPELIKVTEELRDEIMAYAEKHPEIIKEYREGFPVVLTL
ncbi:MAG: hypothetical protein Q4B67_01400 [Eubacteriales bacterium]|nr:hypothetical protein [Eubacteriales bacterium]